MSMIHWPSLIIGLVIGTCMGLVLLSLCLAGERKEQDD